MSWTGRLMLLNNDTNQSDLQVLFNPIKILMTLLQKVKHVFDSEESRSPSCTGFYKVFPENNVQTARWKYVTSNLWVDLGCLFTTHFNILTGLAVCMHVHPPSIWWHRLLHPSHCSSRASSFKAPKRKLWKFHTHDRNTSQVSGKNIAIPRATSSGFRSIGSFRTHW